MGQMHAKTNQTDELLRAEREVEQTKAELARNLQRVGRTSATLVHRVQAELKPGLVVAAAVVGAVVVTGAVVALTRRRRHQNWLAPQQPSALGVVAKTVGIWVLRLAARNVAQAVVARLQQTETETSPASLTGAPAAE